MKQIKIRFENDVTEAEALSVVQDVVAEGRVSMTEHGPSYCHVTMFRSGPRELVCAANRTATMDTFSVWHKEKQP